MRTIFKAKKHITETLETAKELMIIVMRNGRPVGPS
jgi:hypothetical protein